MISALSAQLGEASVASAMISLLAAQIRGAIEIIPLAHLISPASGKAFEEREGALRRLQDWAFTQDFAIVTESVKIGSINTKGVKTSNRVAFQCVHHRDKTRNSQKIATENRERVETAVRAKSCKWGV